MSPSEDQIKSEHFIYFESLLQEGKYSEAEEYQKEKDLSVTEISPFVIDAFNTAEKAHDVGKALKIAETFRLVKIDTRPIIKKEWSRLHKEGEFEESAKWAINHDLSDVQIRRSAKSAYSKYLKEGKIDDSLRIMKEYTLAKEDVLEESIAEFKRAYIDGEYYTVAILGHHFEFSAQTTYNAAVQSCILLINSRNFEQVSKLLVNFNILDDTGLQYISDDESEKLLIAVLNKMIIPELSQGNIKTLTGLIKKTNLFDKYCKNKTLKKFILKIQENAIITHNTFLEREEVKSAMNLCAELNLLVAKVPRDLQAQFSNAVEKFHHTLLKNDKLDTAIEFKKFYHLFEEDSTPDSQETAMKFATLFVTGAFKRREFKAAAKAIKEYKIPDYATNDALCKALEDLLQLEKIEEIFILIDAFQLDTTRKKVVDSVLKIYNSMMGMKEYMHAANFALHLKLNKTFIEQAARKAWEMDFYQDNFDEALRIKKKYRLPKKQTLPLAQQKYWQFFNLKNVSGAISIRRSYGVSIGFMQWMKEVFFLFFTKK